jgi:aryl-alcohol dehydrogenase-like predicted oxidoreductase
VRVVSEEAADEFLNSVLDAGINFIDTAPDYGVSEQRIGQYISSRRSEFFLATKCGCVYTQHEDRLELDHTWKKEVIQRNIETSLQRLRTDFVDVLQFHGGDAETLKREGLIELLMDFRDQGMVRFIGASSSLPHLPGLIELGVFDTFQIPYSCLAPQHHDLITRATETGAGIIIRGGIAQGGPDAEIQRAALNDIWTRAKLDEVLSNGMNRAEMILRYTISHPQCNTTIVGTCNAAHLAENVAAAAKGPLPTDLYDEVASRVATLDN